MKSKIYMRRVFDTECREISRNFAAMWLAMERKHLIKIQNGYKFLLDFEYCVFSYFPIDENVNF